MDQISNLPTTILHNVLTRLPNKDVVRTSILSKAWKEIWSTFPILIFDESRYRELEFHNLACPKNAEQMEYYERKTQEFLISVDHTLRRFKEQGLVVKELKLKMELCDHLYKIPHLDLWMDLASEIGIEVLQLELITPASSLDEVPPWEYEHYEFYSLPPSVLQFKSLTKLILSGPITIDQVFLNHPIKFASLQVLSLTYIYLRDEQVIQHIISSCPLVEYIILKHCLGLNSLTIHGLPRLKGIEVSRIPKVVVDAPRLENFCYGMVHSCQTMPISVMCKKLRGLHLHNIDKIIDKIQWLHEIFDIFPLLESLELNYVPTPHRVTLSSCHLKVLKVIKCYGLKELRIDAPNLYFCEFGDRAFTIPVISFLNNSRQLEVNVRIQINNAWEFQYLRELLESFKPRNVLASLTVHIMKTTIDDWNFNGPPDISTPLPHIKQLEVQVYSFTENVCLHLIGMLLWCCHPAIISMKLNHVHMSSGRTFIKLLCKKLKRRLKGNNCYCNLRSTKCWLRLCSRQIKHGLKDIKVICSSRTHEDPLDCETFIDKLPTLPHEEDIRFLLEW